MSLWHRLVLFLLLPASAMAGEWSGSVSLQTRLFSQGSVDHRQDKQDVSLAFLPEYYTEWNGGRDSLVFEPFIRIDSDDRERTHADIREFMWTHVGDQWEMHLGVGKVFWGVTESRHLVDIINQTDLVENIDGEDKLGQPMLHLSWVRDWGTVDWFLLPWFRERTFPGKAGRLRSMPRVDDSLATYDDRRKRRHVDTAIRWSRSHDIWDIGLSWFAGTSRDPSLTPAINNKGEPVLAPHYDQVRQAGADVQATIDQWLLKFEGIRRSGQGKTYHATVTGFEYTFVGILDTSHDLGVLAEYLYDERGHDAPHLFEDDLFVGARWVWNDSRDTTLLAGIIQDTGSSERVLRLEGSRRVGRNLKLNVEVQGFSNIPASSAFRHFNREDFVQVELAWYF